MTYQPMEYTGERMVPEKSEPNVFWEHIYRYRFALPYVVGKRVLDIACGEGYGSSAMTLAGATSVIGVDISEETCSHARQKYGIDARVGSAEQIPLSDRSVDIIVSFETIEHLSQPELFLKECARVLVPGGILVISTPNKAIYRYSGEQHNPHHVHEMNEDEFLEALSEHFPQVQAYIQNIKTARWFSPFTLAADISFWVRTPFLRRIRGRLRRELAPNVWASPADDNRLSVDKTISEKDGFGALLANPYLVHKRSGRNAENPIYIVAVAQKPEQR